MISLEDLWGQLIENFHQLNPNKNTIDTNDHKTDKYLNKIDPDQNYLFNDTCDYTYNTEEIKVNSSDGLTMVTFNIRSIKKNFDKFEQLLCRLKCKIHIICLTETWLNDLDNINIFYIH